MNYKNTRPIAVNNNMIYYMRVFNDREESKIKKELWKYDLNQEKDILVDTLEEKEFPKAPDGSHMFAA